MSTDVQLPENLSGYASQRQRPHSANSDGSRSGSPNSPSPKPPTLNANSLAASALMLQMYPHFQDRRLLEEHQSPANFNAAALCDQFCNVINGFRGGVPGGFQDPRKSPGVPCSRPSVDATECRLIDYRGQQVAAFNYQGDYLLCLPQAFELFLKHLVGGLHTVYAKLKRLGISPIVCNVEQVRVLRGLGAIQPGVNRCKLLACKDFDVLYKDCTTARPGRPPGRASLVGLSGVGATSPASGGHGGHQGSGGHPGGMQGAQPGPFPPGLIGGHKGPQGPIGVGGPFGQTTHDGVDGSGTGPGAFEFRRESRGGDDEVNGGRNGQGGPQSDRGQSPLEHHGVAPGAAGGHNRNSSHLEHGGNHLKQESRSDEDTAGGAGGGLTGMGADADSMNTMQAMLFKAMWSQSGGQGDPKGPPPFPPALVANMAAAQLPGQPPMNPAMAAAMASQMDLMLGLQHNPQIAAAAAAAYQRQLLQAASLAQQQIKGGQQQSKEHQSLMGALHAEQRTRSRSPDSASKKEFRSRESQSPAAGGGHPRTEHHQSRKSSFESSKKMHNNNSISSSLNSSAGAPGAPGAGLEGATSNVLNLSSGGKELTTSDRKKRSRSVSSDEGSLSDGPLSELSANNIDNNDDTSNYGDDDDLDKTGGRSPKRASDRDEALSTSSRESERRRSHGGGGNGGLGALGVLGLERLTRGEARDSRDSNHSVPTPIALMQQHLSVDRTPPPGSPTSGTHLTNSSSTPGSRGAAGQHQHNQHQHHHHLGNSVQSTTSDASTGSFDALMQNILGLLKVAEENARAQVQQMHLEKAELKVEILRERGIREQLEKQLQEEQHRRLFYQKKLRREKRSRRQMQEQLDSSNKRPRLSGCSDADEEKEDPKEDVQEAQEIAKRSSQELATLVGSGSEEPITAQTASAPTTSVSNGLLPSDAVLALEPSVPAADGLTR